MWRNGSKHRHSRERIQIETLHQLFERSEPRRGPTRECRRELGNAKRSKEAICQVSRSGERAKARALGHNSSC